MLLVGDSLAITPANAPSGKSPYSCLCGGLSQNIFAEVANSVMLLIYLSLEAFAIDILVSIYLRDPLLHVHMKQMGFE